MLKCKEHGHVYKNPYCKLYGGYCDTWRLLWCKHILFGVFMAFSIAFFAYGIVAAWQNAEDRVDLRKKVEANRIEVDRRMDALERRIKATDKTIVQHWKWELKEFGKLKRMEDR